MEHCLGIVPAPAVYILRFLERAAGQLHEEHGQWWRGGAEMSASAAYTRTFGYAVSCSSMGEPLIHMYLSLFWVGDFLVNFRLEVANLILARLYIPRNIVLDRVEDIMSDIVSLLLDEVSQLFSEPLCSLVSE